MGPKKEINASKIYSPVGEFASGLKSEVDYSGRAFPRVSAQLRQSVENTVIREGLGLA